MKKLVLCLISICLILSGCEKRQDVASSFFVRSIESKNTETDVSDISISAISIEKPDKFLYEDLCFEENDVSVGYEPDIQGEAAAVFCTSDSSVIYSKNVYQKVYPASTTKLLTTLTAVKYGDMDAVYTVKEDNCGITIPGAQLCGFKKGDTITLKQLLYCLMIYSGNDAGVAISECVSGSVDAFVEQMNKVAASIGCINTRMANPHGLHDLNHYTTPYDIYLIFHECLKSPVIRDIISQTHYTCTFSDIDGNEKTLEMEPTNLYFAGEKIPPEGISVIGGKTGVTSAAGYCLVIASENEEGQMYITEIFKSTSYDALYQDMNILLNMCN